MAYRNLSSDIFGAVAMWRRSVLIHFSGLGLSRALLPFFMKYSTHFLFFRTWAFLGRMGRPVVWKQCFSRIFMSKSMVFGV